MGRVKEYFYELQEQGADRHLAKVLGITYEDLIQLSWTIENVESDDGQVYHYIIVFSEDSSTEILNKIEGLEEGRFIYLEPWELDENYDYDEQFEAISENPNYYKKFNDEILNLELLSNIEIESEELKNILNRQIYVSIIGVMETFLSDAFVNLTFKNKDYFKNFIENHPEFKKRKFELREIFREQEKLNETAKKIMIETIYHNLPSVSQMFEDTFRINFPQIKKIYNHVLMRHDLVHRNGKTKEGHTINTNVENIKILIFDIKEFISDIAGKLSITN